MRQNICLIWVEISILRQYLGMVLTQMGHFRGLAMTAIGYARVSTTDQDLTVQIEALKGAGCDVIRKEKASGTSTKGRTELATILDFIREGDTLVVTRIDRLARSIADLQDIVRTLKGRGAALRATEQPINTATAAGKCFLDMPQACA